MLDARYIISCGVLRCVAVCGFCVHSVGTRGCTIRDKTNGHVCENRAQLVTVELEEATVEGNVTICYGVLQVFEKRQL